MDPDGAGGGEKPGGAEGGGNIITMYNVREEIYF